jgi:DNA-binding FrmR family transcriptional regulator
MKEAHVHLSHPEIVKRLKRAEGHIKRVIAMFGEDRTCLELAQQLHAVEKAIGEAKRQLIHDHVDHCLDAAVHGNGKPTKAVVNEFKEISRYL